MTHQRLIQFILAVTVIIINVSPGYTQDKVGTSAAPFLGIALDPIGAAMGGAYVSYGRDASALYWNPGAIAFSNNSFASFAHTEWFIGTDYNWMGLIFNIGNGNAFGAQIAVLDYGEEEVTTHNFPDGTGAIWDAQDLFATLSYARKFTNDFSIGGSFKIIRERIWNETASAFAVDLGLIYVTPFNGMRLGMSISNFGTEMTMDGKDLFHQYDQDPEVFGNNATITSKLKTDPWPLPLFFRLGISMDVVQIDQIILTLATDAVVPSDNTTVINVGGEFAYRDLLFLRAGYKSLGRSETQEGLTAGLGVAFNVPGLSKIAIDYAFTDFGILGDIHTYGVGFIF
jgi:hypothetical protein